MCLIVLEQSHYCESWLTFLRFLNVTSKKHRSHVFLDLKKRKNVFSNCG